MITEETVLTLLVASGISPGPFRKLSTAGFHYPCSLLILRGLLTIPRSTPLEIFKKLSYEATPLVILYG